ncbi:MAG TPA: tetraacyldisaccharide 4'-kinase [Acetobacteraceae bacterium]|jgi:tetraacyldisaccharide 4'-kinase|nr:tetraacyldisaccharide 4'-kinase [Acetobacteraceae bacterium]
MLLAPAAAAYAAATARRVARSGWRAPVPVICCGNPGVGGSGKTTVALDLGRRLQARGRAVAFLTRGYGADEDLLLAAVAPTFVDGDRAKAAQVAVAAGADVLVMDDGLQNPTLEKTVSLLVVDGAVGFGNGRVLPAGPLREPVAAAAGRCDACIMIGTDQAGAAAVLPPGLPVLRAALRSRYEAAGLAGRPLFAFAGIARPAKFFESLREAGATVAGERDFPDHHGYTHDEVRSVLAAAQRLGAVPVTTPKDAVRLPPGLAGAITVIDVALAWDDLAAIEGVLDRALTA